MNMSNYTSAFLLGVIMHYMKLHEFIIARIPHVTVLQENSDITIFLHLSVNTGRFSKGHTKVTMTPGWVIFKTKALV